MTAHSFMSLSSVHRSPSHSLSSLCVLSSALLQLLRVSSHSVSLLSPSLSSLCVIALEPSTKSFFVFLSFLSLQSWRLRTSETLTHQSQVWEFCSWTLGFEYAILGFAQKFRGICSN